MLVFFIVKKRSLHLHTDAKKRNAGFIAPYAHGLQEASEFGFSRERARRTPRTPQRYESMRKIRNTGVIDGLTAYIPLPS